MHHASGQRVVWGDPKQGHVEQSGVEVLAKELGVGFSECPQLLLHVQHVPQQHVGGGVGLAGDEHPEGALGLQ
jgi:hypothetical protein